MDSKPVMTKTLKKYGSSTIISFSGEDRKNINADKGDRIVFTVDKVIKKGK
jgi:hypothetical protein